MDPAPTPPPSCSKEEREPPHPPAPPIAADLSWLPLRLALANLAALSPPAPSCESTSSSDASAAAYEYLLPFPPARLALALGMGLTRPVGDACARLGLSPMAEATRVMRGPLPRRCEVLLVMAVRSDVARFGLKKEAEGKMFAVCERGEVGGGDEVVVGGELGLANRSTDGFALSP